MRTMIQRIFANKKNIQLIALCIAVLGISCSNKDHEKNIMLQMGNDEMTRGNYDEAIDFYDRALQLDPEFADAFNNMGVAFYENGEPGMALENYNQALRLRPEYYEAILNRSNAYAELDRFDAALEDVETLRGVFPDTSTVYFASGLIKTKANDYQSAIAAFKEAGKRDSENAEVPINIGTIHYYQKQYDSARYYLNQALAIEPGHGSAFNTMALMSVEDADYEEALLLINKALDYASNDPFFINNRGYIYLQMDSISKAEADINESIRIDPYNGWAYRNRALVRMKQGQFEAATGLLKRAIYEDAKVDLVFYYLGESLFASGDNKGACDAWARSAEMGEQESENRIQAHCSGV